MKISACLITLNEEENIERALKSLYWADEIVVVDSGSADQTLAVAERFKVKVIHQDWLGFGRQKQFAVEQAAHDWIFSLDADEELSPELIAEILRIKNSQSEDLADAYKIPRLAFYLGRPIYHGGWYPDWQIRFFNRRGGRWSEAIVHESFQVDGGKIISKLKGHLLHYSFKSLLHHHQQIGSRYAPLAAQKMFLAGRRTNKFKIMTAGFIKFVHAYFIKAGFLDGFAGFCIARFAAHHDFLKHSLLLELQKEAEVSPDAATKKSV